MSGIEIAGLVIGAFPLVVWTLQQYHAQGKALFHVETEYQRLLRDVEVEQTFFRNVLLQVFSPLCTGKELSDDDLEELLQDPTGAQWDTDDVKSVVTERLGQADNQFVGLAKSLNSTLSKLLFSLVNNKPILQQKLKQKLVSDLENEKTPRNKLSMTACRDLMKHHLQYRKEKLELGVGVSAHKELVAEMHRDVEKLERLLVQSDKLATLRTSRRLPISPKAIKSLLRYWQHADQVHTLFSQAWECSCRERHCAHMWLQHRRAANFEMQFLVLYASQEQPLSELPPWFQQGIRITWQDSKLSNSVAIGKIESEQPAALLEAVGRNEPPSKRRRKVGFAKLKSSLQIDGAANRSPVLAFSSVATNHGVIQSSSLSPISSSDVWTLCEALARCGMQSVPIGAFNSQEPGKIYAVQSEPEQKVAGDAVTLRDILNRAIELRIRRADRYRIALKLASSHLQLRSTSWARRQWEAGDIHFPKDSDGQVLYDRPYTSTSFAETLPASEQTPTRSDRSFACLGIMLLELLFGTCLEQHRLWDMLGFGDKKSVPSYRLLVARQWADAAEDEGGQPFAAAIMWCLNESPTTLTGEGWRKELADRVVLPLEQGCDWIKDLP